MKYYECVRCQILHWEDEQIFALHLDYQSKHGIMRREKPKEDRQTSLVTDYGFPRVNTVLHLGEKSERE